MCLTIREQAILQKFLDHQGRNDHASIVYQILPLPHLHGHYILPIYLFVFIV